MNAISDFFAFLFFLFCEMFLCEKVGWGVSKDVRMNESGARPPVQVMTIVNVVIIIYLVENTSLLLLNYISRGPK